ncbi:MAG TPA: hypothetical protein VJ751_04335 [Pyrinomonadaceae bacterium]|jgi:hypothetical protein|nr:hypothetical protein [Pyrinomonadaceae bacterium]
MWLKIAYTLFICVLIPVYWKQYGPGNFLWFSDIALFVTAVALWLESSLLASMMALSVVVLESIWIVDFLIGLIFGSPVIGLSAYMFDSKIPLSIRALSLFHIVLPILLLWLLYRLGYDRRALLAQTVLAWIVLPLSYFLAKPSDNVNWVYGLGGGTQKWMPAPVYLVLLMIAFPIVVYLPTHFLLKKLFN